MSQPTHRGLDPLLSEAIFGTIRDPMVVLTDDLRVIVASRAFYKKFHLKREEVEGAFFYNLSSGQWNIPRLRALLEKVIPEQETVEGYVVEHDPEAFGPCVMVVSAREIKYKNGQRKMLLSFHDVTEQRADEEQKRKLMEQKDILLKEMRHRIANSLQLIASIILLKAASVPSEESRMHLQDAHDRIVSIATVQRNLDPTGDNHEVPVVEYLTTLCKSLAKSMIGGRKPITLTVHGTASATVLPDEAISIGLMTTELVINSLKHAFPSGEGSVTVAYEMQGDEWMLAISDDGIGYSIKNRNASDGLGTNIIDSLAKQLNATVKRESSSKGTTVSVSGHTSRPTHVSKG